MPGTFSREFWLELVGERANGGEIASGHKASRCFALPRSPRGWPTTLTTRYLETGGSENHNKDVKKQYGKNVYVVNYTVSPAYTS